MPRSRILIALMLFLGGAPRAAKGQTITPVIAEYRGARAEGSFQIRNPTLRPFIVVLRPMSFSVNSAGRPAYRALDPDISLQLSSKSFPVPPRRQFTVYYRVRARHLPAWFTIYAAIVPKTRAGGMNLVIDLPHTVYLLNKRPLSLNDVRFENAKLNSATNQLSAVIENTSAKFGRVKEIEVSSDSAKRFYPGFPLFPGQRRVVHLAWEKRGRPKNIQLRFSKFKLDHAVRVHGHSR